MCVIADPGKYSAATVLNLAGATAFTVPLLYEYECVMQARLTSFGSNWSLHRTLLSREE